MSNRENQMQLKAIKNTLVTRRRELEPRVSRDDIAIERASESIDIVQHSASRELAISSLSMHWRTIREVDAALGRITDGSYGICVLCEEPISERRLRAIPWADCCIRCQEARDREGRTEEPLHFAADAA